MGFSRIFFFQSAVGQTLSPKQHLCPSPHFHNPGTRPDCKAGLSRAVVRGCGCAKAMAAVTLRARLDPPPAPSHGTTDSPARREPLRPAKPAETPSRPCPGLDLWSFLSLSCLTLGQLGDGPFSRAAAPLDFMDQQTPAMVTARTATSKARHELCCGALPAPSLHPYAGHLPPASSKTCPATQSAEKSIYFLCAGLSFSWI